LGCLRRNLGLLGLLGVACVVVAHASAARAPTLFRLTIIGTAHQQWSYTGGPVETGDCTLTDTSEGIRTARFRTKTPVIVRLGRGRMLPVDVGGIAGTVTLSGADTTKEICREATKGQTSKCAPTKRTFSKATLHAASPRPGVVVLDAIANVRLAVATCPAEPPDVRQRTLGPPPNLVRLPKEALLEGRLARINLRVARNRRTVYGSPAAGQLDESAEWKLEFVRVQG
jgi:hypothetical protein